MVKMKVTTQGEEVINLLWDVIAAKGFEKDTYFEMAARDIRALPKLEGTVHVNIALIVKFMANYFFNPASYPPIPRRDDPQDDIFLWNQGPARGLGQIRFNDYRLAFEGFDLPNVKLFQEQTSVLQEFLATATPDEAQQKDVDFLLALGELFALVVYAQLILENARIYEKISRRFSSIRSSTAWCATSQSTPCSFTQNRAAQAARWSFACACCASRWLIPGALTGFGSRCTLYEMLTSWPKPVFGIRLI
jgi:hypothetical protein